MAQPAETIQNGLFESDRLKFYPITEPDFPLNTFYGLLTKRTHEPNPKDSGNVPWVLPVQWQRAHTALTDDAFPFVLCQT